MGQKGAQICDVIFEDCRVPAEAIIGGREGQGFKTAMKVLDRGRLTISGVCIGVAERLIRESLRYASERNQFGKPIAEFQLVQAMLADSETECYAAKSMVLDAARRKDAGQTITKQAAMCKYYASEMVGRVADRAVQIHGGAGYLAEYGIERFYRDVRLFRIYEGTSQIQQLVIARSMLKEQQAVRAIDSAVPETSRALPPGAFQRIDQPVDHWACRHVPEAPAIRQGDVAWGYGQLRRGRRACRRSADRTGRPSRRPGPGGPGERSGGRHRPLGRGAGRRLDRARERSPRLARDRSHPRSRPAAPHRLHARGFAGRRGPCASVTACRGRAVGLGGLGRRLSVQAQG